MPVVQRQSSCSVAYRRGKLFEISDMRGLIYVMHEVLGSVRGKPAAPLCFLVRRKGGFFRSSVLGLMSYQGYVV